MELFTSEIIEKLINQYPLGGELDNQQVICKIFNPYGLGIWYCINMDPEDCDYIWCIADVYECEVGSVLRSELESIRVPPFGLPLERDLHFNPINAQELFLQLLPDERE
uniref:DUF2958 domain-containing protein n=1 Tax=Roseihalotalea indica TaxID=2867963 RepID=A0AA49GJG2_9BACT|nr:DUF2958 domain-containing protein [Tunicatimonas sp. TK19036]